MTETTLTMEQAADLPLAGEVEASTSQAVATSPESYTYDTPDELHVSLPDHAEDRSLSLDEASLLEIDDQPKPVSDLATALTSASVVAMLDDRPVTLGELIGRYRSAEHIERTIEWLANEHREVQGAAQAVVASAMELARLLSANLPPEPDPSLSQTAPYEYVTHRARYDEAYAGVANAMMQAQQAKAASDTLDARHRQRVLETENAKLAQHFPETVNGEARQRFFGRLMAVAHACDFSEADLRAVVDHRVFRLADLAYKGLQAAQGQKQGQRPSRKQKRRHSDAMAHLARVGTIDAAMAVDFD